MYIRKKILVILLFPVLVGCENEQHDLVIQKAARNCECSKEIKRAQMEKVREIEEMNRRFGGFNRGPTFGTIDCSDPFYVDGEHKREYSKTKTLEIFNKSETKVYQVMIQFKNSGKVNYETYYIEPTQNIVLGCNFDFRANFDTLSPIAKSLDIDKIELTDFEPIEYNLHKISVFSEY